MSEPISTFAALGWDPYSPTLAEKYHKDAAFYGVTNYAIALRAEVERLTADNARIQRIAHAAGVIDLIHAERALADQLAAALQGHPHKSAIPNDEEWAITVDMRRAALTAWEAARHE